MTRIAWTSRIAVVSAVVASSTVGLAGAAYAASAVAYVDAEALWYYDTPGSGASSLIVRSSAAGFILDHIHFVNAGSGCSHPDPADLTKVLCVGTIESVEVRAGAGDDYVDYWPTGARALTFSAIDGGAGNDTIIGGDGPGKIWGGPGDDYLNGWSGGDTLSGGDGADQMIGGDGDDIVSYGGSVVGVVASLNGAVGDDGAPGEGDTIAADVESLEGGAGNDKLLGNAGDNSLFGCEGSDDLYGYGGTDYLSGEGDFTCFGVPVSADLLVGGDGVDTVSYNGSPAAVTVDLDGATGDDGAPGEGDTIIEVENVLGSTGPDVLTGSGDANTLDGQAGGDVLFGLAGPDHLLGTSGDDVLSGGDGPDILEGGPDTDICDLGSEGLVALTCE